MSYVYFIRVAPDGPIKIGYTERDPSRRRDALQTGCPSIIKIIGAIAAPLSKEREMHMALAAWRLAGEWFTPSDAVMAAIGAALEYGDRLDIEADEEIPASVDDHRGWVASFFEKLGGTTYLRQITGASPNSISNWRVMGRIPWRFQAILTEVATRQGISIPETVWGTRWNKKDHAA